MEWSGFDGFGGNPYVEWRRRVIPTAKKEVEQEIRFGDLGLSFADGDKADLIESFHFRANPTEEISLRSVSEVYEQALSDVIAFLPREVVNAPPANQDVKTATKEVREKLPVINDPDTVIMGVIDVGMPLGHRRLRDAEGKTRILASWQQLAMENSSAVPFGHELYKSDIDRLLAAHSPNGLDGWLDEDSFNRATHVIDMENTFGEREAARRAAHGAHVLDLAAGYDPRPGQSGTDLHDKIKIIAVNFPSIDVVGNSGELLDGLVLTAYERIIALADAIWEKSFGDTAQPGAQRSFRTVINMSLGRQAGPKNGIGLIPAYLSTIKRRRGAETESQLNFVMPAGNDNLSRCHAILEPPPKKTLYLNWRIQPQDQSDNYVEVWTQPPRGMGDLLRDEPQKIDIRLIAPDGTISPLQTAEAHIVSYYGNQAAVFRETHARFDDKPEDGDGEDDFEPVWMLRHLFVVSPTHRALDDRDTAEAGLWKIRIENKTTEQVHCVCTVQTDQGLLPGNAESLRSYFDDPDYVLYDDYEGMGDLRQTYAYQSPKPGPKDNQDLRPHPETGRASQVKRHGTVNSTAAHNIAARVSGYRVSDGRAAAYSSSGIGRPPKNGQPSEDSGAVVPVDGAERAARAPTASFPTEDAPMHPGVLGAGGADGSVVAMRGTSFASPQAARLIAEELAEARFLHQSEKRRLFVRAKKLEDEDHANETSRKTRKRFSAKPRLDDWTEVMGRGRVEPQEERQADRIGMRWST